MSNHCRMIFDQENSDKTQETTQNRKNSHFSTALISIKLLQIKSQVEIAIIEKFRGFWSLFLPITNVLWAFFFIQIF